MTFKSSMILVHHIKMTFFKTFLKSIAEILEIQSLISMLQGGEAAMDRSPSRFVVPSFGTN